MVPPLFSAQDAQDAYNDWGCNCGPGALAAIVGVPLKAAGDAIPAFYERHYTSPPMMNAALRALRIPFQKIGAKLPTYGLVRVQWEGPWTAPGARNIDRYRKTHWIGAQKLGEEVAIFDINIIANGSGWTRKVHWEDVVAPWLSALYPHSTGRWRIANALEIFASGR